MLSTPPPPRRTWIAIALCSLTPLGFLLSQRLIPAAYAQAMTDEDVDNYAQAISQIEPQRLAAYEAASDILVSAASELDILEFPLRCTATELSDMPDIPRPDRLDLLTVLVDFCNEASQLAEANDLTPLRFNSITAAHREDPELAQRIQAELSSL